MAAGRDHVGDERLAHRSVVGAADAIRPVSEPNVIETERLALRRLTLDDLDALAAIYSDTDVRKYFPEGTLTREQTKEELEMDHQRLLRPIRLWALGYHQ